MLERLSLKTRTCPHCRADLRGDPIPEEHLVYYNKLNLPRDEWDTFFYSRIIGIELLNDRIEGWRCPDCGLTDWIDGTTTPSRNSLSD